jgi:hypothetical protein
MSSGSEFEKRIDTDLKVYAMAGVANLAMLPVPTKTIFFGGQTKIIRTGDSPFDVWGYTTPGARTIGAELKSIVRNNLPIVEHGKSGDGIHYHQLCALARLAEAGGIARIVWENEGQIGVLKGEQIIVAKAVFDVTQKGSRDGGRSIPWSAFATAKLEAVGPRRLEIVNWLMLETGNGEPKASRVREDGPGASA